MQKQEYLYQKMNEYNINYISNVELPEEKSFEEQIYNVKFDAGHWNDLERFYGTNHLLEKVSEYFLVSGGILQEILSAVKKINIDKLKAKRLNPSLSQVMHTPHDSYGLQELSCPTERQDGITTIEINLHSNQEDITEYDFGYLVMGEYVFDLELDGERAVCAAASEYAADSAFDSARVERFVKQGDED